jgi:hypothetical protein
MKNPLTAAFSEEINEFKLETLVNPLRAAIRRKNEYHDHHQTNDQCPNIFPGEYLFQDHL